MFRKFNKFKECGMLSSGSFSGVHLLYANVPDLRVCSIFIGVYEDGTDSVPK
jgi:hypothetical protein